MGHSTTGHLAAHAPTRSSLAVPGTVELSAGREKRRDRTGVVLDDGWQNSYRKGMNGAKPSPNPQSLPKTVSVVLALFALSCGSGDAGREDPAASNGNGTAANAANQTSGAGATAEADSTIVKTTGAEGRFGEPMFTGSSTSSDRYAQGDVTRDGVSYKFMANGWGPGFGSQAVSWSGTSFNVLNMEGEQGQNYEPASYPTLFCGQYSNTASGECGLPLQIASITSLQTGWSWRANGNNGEYNAAYDVWIGDANRLQSYFMVWLRDPRGQQPHGARIETNISVEGVPGEWSLWQGSFNNGGSERQILSYTRPEGQDLEELEFDLMDFIQDARDREVMVPGEYIRSVAIGFEIWNGPIENLETLDFYVDVQ